MNLSALLHSDLVWLAPALAVAGVATGVLAGLFGVGGGAIIVPVLYQTLRFTGVPDEVAMPVSVGTSLAVIVPTSLASARTHFSKNAVDMATIRGWIVPVVVSVALGAAIARNAPAALFKLVFVGISMFTAVRMLGGYTNWKLGEKPPKGPVSWAVGGTIGLLSALMGVGGGQLVNLYMSLYGAPIHLAVGTAAGVGALVSAPGAIGYALAGLGKPGLPPGSIGFVSLIGFAFIAPMAALAAPYGARLAHKWSKRRLELA
ncbi:MAG: sulfite exporter TauE/SafE family protein, partial [Hyphomicrobiales bacterium]|nr:sulfite exporter TauE/SafE family protein [Hyphomicrobiales bacterium]